MESGQDWKIAALTINKCVCFLFVGDKMDDKYVKKIIKLSQKSLKYNDVPVGALIVENGKIISQAFNTKYKNSDVTAHAEMIAIRKACKRKKTTYLNDCILYVTLEPCMMCTAAILQSHIKEVIYCVKSPKYGYLLHDEFEKRVKISQKYNLEYENILKSFFKDKR